MPKNKLYCIKSVYWYSFVFQCGDALHLSLTRENHSSGTLTADVLSCGCSLNYVTRAFLTNGAYSQWTFNKNKNKERTKIYIHKMMFLF